MTDRPASAVEDELAIRNLLARLAQLADGDDVDAYVELFAPDASWEMPGAPRTGRADIRAGSEARRAAGEVGRGSNSRHVVATIAVDVDGDRATSDSYWMFYVDTSNAPRLQAMGTYRDEFVRAGGRWQLARRQIGFG